MSLNIVSFCVFALLGLLNAAIYRHHRRRWASHTAREPQAMSRPTRQFRHLQRWWALIGLVGLVWHDFVAHPEGPSSGSLFAGAAMGLGGLALLHAALSALGSSFAPCHDARVPEARVVAGPYALVGHPVYLANLCVVAGVVLAHRAPWSVGLWLALVVLYAISARDEERMLRARFGPRGVTFRTLASPEELHAFSEGYARAWAGRPIALALPPDPFELARTHRLVGVFRESKMVAGWAMGLDPLRTLGTLPAERRDAMLDELGRDQVVELVAIWKERGFPRVSFALRVWPRIVVEVLALRRPHVFGCALAGHGMQSTYRLLRPVVVHDGARPGELTVFRFHRSLLVWTLIAGYAVLPFGLLRGALRARRRAEAGTREVNA